MARADALVLVLVLALAVAAACGDEADGFTRARAMLADRHRFSTAIESGETLAEVADLLLADARRCERSCDVRFSAAAHARVLALRVLGCTAPGREATRASLAAHLDAIAEGVEDPVGPSVPPCPSAR